VSASVPFWRFLSVGLKRWFPAETTQNWLVLAKAMQAVPLTAAELKIWRELTGRKAYLTEPPRECFLVLGRRSGKSLFTSAWMTYAATILRHPLRPGETGTAVLIAVDRRQARVLMNYVKAFCEHVPHIKAMVESITADTVTFKHGTAIEIHTASFKTTRGYSVISAGLDEGCFLKSEQSAEPAHEIVTALLPGMATIPQAALLMISSPHAMRGLMFEMWEKHFGQDDSDVLVVQAASKTMNPTLPQSVIDHAYARDPIAAAAEFGGLFRSDVEAVVNRELLAQCVIPDRGELPPAAGVRYFAGIDPSGGAGQDWFCVAVGHLEADTLVADVVRGYRERGMDLKETIRDISETLKRYGVHRALSDRYSAMFAKQEFARHGVTVIFSKATASEAMRDLIPTLPRMQLPDHALLQRELLDLERRVLPGGREQYGHGPRGAKDDHVAALALMARQALKVDFVLTLADRERPDGAGDSLGQAADRPSPMAGLDPVVLDWATRHGHLGPGRMSEGDIKAARAAYRLAWPLGDVARQSDRNRMRRSGIPDSDDDLMFRRVPEGSEAL